ncbi:MAG: PIN domain-containing protein [Nanoarchaeota archaeon]
MNTLFIDSSAWIEYFAGTEKGRRIREYIQKEGVAIHITGLIVSEVCTKFLKDGLVAEQAMVMLRDLSVLQPYDYELGLETAKIYVKERKTRPKFGLADAHVLAASRKKKAKLITCDRDFEGIAEVVLIK